MQLWVPPFLNVTPLRSEMTTGATDCVRTAGASPNASRVPASPAAAAPVPTLTLRLTNSRRLIRLGISLAPSAMN